MNLIERVELYLKMWRLTLPHISEPPSEDAARWGLYPMHVVEAAILRTGKRFARTKITPDFVPEQAYRYATATARSIASYEKGKL